MLNEVKLIGHVGADPETGTVPSSGNKYAHFNLATSERWTDKTTGEKKERTEWHRVVVWGNDVIEKVVTPYIKKGARIFIAGKLQTDKYTDDKGVEKFSTKVVVQGFGGIILLDRKENNRRDDEPIHEPERLSGSGGGHVGGGNGSVRAQGQRPLDDEIPF